MRYFVTIIFTLIFLCPKSYATFIRPGKNQEGIIELDHGTILKGNFKVVPHKDFFTVLPTRFKAKLYHLKNRNPKEEEYTARFFDFEKDKRSVIKYRLKISNAFQNGIDLNLTNDQRLILMDLELDEAKTGTVIFLKEHVYKNYQGSLESYNFDGNGKIEMKDGTILWGEFKYGYLTGAFINPKSKTLYIYLKDIIQHTFKMEPKICHDAYLGKFQVNKGDCNAKDLYAHAVNFENKIGVIKGHFQNGKLIEGDIFAFSPWSLGTVGKIEEGKPVRIVKKQSKDDITIGSLLDGKFDGQVIKISYKNGHKFIENYRFGKKNGAYRFLNENNVILEKGNYKNDLKDGEIFTYYDSVKVKTIENYQNGKPTGKTTKFGIDGAVLKAKK